MTPAKIGAIVMAALLVMYVVLLGNTAIILLNSPTAIAKAIGGLLTAFPLLGAWLIVAELRFGLRLEKLQRRVQSENAWPHFDFELRPSGRPVRASADAVFSKYSEIAQQNADDWHNWFNLGLAYDAAGDRRRARAAMRKAIALASKN
jgi:tetratricopeptide (TPR) repeat protein